MMRRIYADHAATTPLMPEALDAMLPFLKENFGNPSSLHGWSRPAKKALADARSIVAECINAEPEEIFFTSGGTESDNWAIKGSTGGLLVSSYEHHAVLNAVASESCNGRDVAYVTPNANGCVTVAELGEVWEGAVGLVSVMTANNEIGSVNSVESLAEFSHSRGALFHTDAVQAVGHVPVDVRAMDVDFLSASAHKFNGPKGIGLLFVRKGLELKSLLDGGQQEFGCRAGTENVASIVGMATALKISCERMNENSKHLNRLAKMLCDGIMRFSDDAVYIGANAECRLPGFVSVSFPGHSAEGLLHLLDLKGIAVSTGAACDSKNTQVSHVLNAIGVSDAIAKSTLRITFGVENTTDDAAAIISALEHFIAPRKV